MPMADVCLGAARRRDAAMALATPHAQIHDNDVNVVYRNGTRLELARDSRRDTRSGRRKSGASKAGFQRKHDSSHSWGMTRISKRWPVCCICPGLVPGYQPNDTPPGGALVFELYASSPRSERSIRANVFSAQTLDDELRAERLKSSSPEINGSSAWIWLSDGFSRLNSSSP
jgi:hypothetical protein